jgi:hypothetical protein
MINIKPTRQHLLRSHEREYMRNQKNTVRSFGATRLIVHGGEISASAKVHSHAPKEMFLADAKTTATEKDADAPAGATYKDHEIEFVI